MKRALGLYVHFPFCKRRCVYCDFFSTVNADLRKAYVAELQNEIRSFSERVGDGFYIDTVYFGGGTPSVLSFSDLKSVAETIYNAFKCEIKEFTVEVNPCSAEDLERYREFGANRLSFGVQSLRNDVLSFLGRLHDRETALNVLDRAKNAGYRVTADLMLGVPEETTADVDSFIRELADRVEHLSAYILKVEEGSELYGKVARGEVQMPTDDEVETSYNRAVSTLSKYGFARYEISNFAKPRAESLHNLKYWRDEEYLGFGASAHSYFCGTRYYNSPDMKSYLKGEHSGNLKELAEPPSSVTPEEEYIMLALRLAEGVNLKSFAEKFNKDLIGIYGNKINRLKDFLISDGSTLRISPDKFLLQTAILTELFS